MDDNPVGRCGRARGVARRGAWREVDICLDSIGVRDTHKEEREKGKTFLWLGLVHTIHQWFKL